MNNNGIIKPVGLKTFNSLNQEQQAVLLEDLEFAVLNAEGCLSLSEDLLASVNKIKALINILFLSLHPSNSEATKIDDLHRDVLELILSRTNPCAVVAARRVNKKFKFAATVKAQIQSIQHQIPWAKANLSESEFVDNLKDRKNELAFTLNGSNFSKVLKWVSQDKECAKSLIIANLRGLFGVSDLSLQAFFQICTNIQYLCIESKDHFLIKSLPITLQIVSIKSTKKIIIRQLFPDVPKSCKVLVTKE